MTNQFETPEKPKTKPAVPSNEFSIFQERYEVARKRIDEIDNRIMEKIKFLDQQTNPEIIKLIKEEIHWLREEKMELRESANIALESQRVSNEAFDNLDPEDEDMVGRT
jgi:CTP:phosphocholine cytidylyltransferase-like protein